jgi:hypothetical protein
MIEAAHAACRAKKRIPMRSTIVSLLAGKARKPHYNPESFHYNDLHPQVAGTVPLIRVGDSRFALLHSPPSVFINESLISCRFGLAIDPWEGIWSHRREPRIVRLIVVN